MSLTVHTRRVRGCTPDSPDCRQVIEFAHYLAQQGCRITIRRKHDIYPGGQVCYSHIVLRIE